MKIGLNKKFMDPVFMSSSFNPSYNPVDRLFAMIQKETIIPLSLTKAELPVQRFSNIDCPRATHLEIEGRPIHANRVIFTEQISYVATGGPYDEFSFENMIKLCTEYGPLWIDLLPNSDYLFLPQNPEEIKRHGTLKITCLSKKKLPGVIYQDFLVEIGDNASLFSRLHYSNWLDQKGILPEELAKLHALADSREFENLIVSCRAGIGRTGTFIVSHALKEAIFRGEITKLTLEQKVKELVLTGREQRGAGFVQTPVQLESILEYGNYLLKKEALPKQELPTWRYKKKEEGVYELFYPSFTIDLLAQEIKTFALNFVNCEEDGKILIEKGALFAVWPNRKNFNTFNLLVKGPSNNQQINGQTLANLISGKIDHRGQVKWAGEGDPPYFFWESQSTPGNIGFWLKGNKKPDLFTPQEFIQILF